MITRLQKSFSTLLVFLLMLSTPTASGVQAEPAASSQSSPYAIPETPLSQQ
jgi:hypothetical protein